MVINCPRCLEPVVTSTGTPGPCPECMAEIEFRLRAWPTRQARAAIWEPEKTEEEPPPE